MMSATALIFAPVVLGVTSALYFVMAHVMEGLKGVSGVSHGASDILFRVGHERRRRPSGPEVPDRPDDAHCFNDLFFGDHGRRDDGRVNDFIDDETTNYYR
jgi:hypothetical protein